MKGFVLIIGFILSFSVLGQKNELSCSGLPDVLFKKGEFDLDHLDMVYLDTVVVFSNENQDVIFVISGHTDSLGDLKYNLKLSRKRVKSVAKYLSKKGINKRKLKLFWFGETKLRFECPRDIECSEEIHQFNRRVEIRLIFPKL
jgi:outer membrane protein OmpA-like peptidoglycan-associated protein